MRQCNHTQRVHHTLQMQRSGHEGLVWQQTDQWLWAYQQPLNAVYKCAHALPAATLLSALLHMQVPVAVSIAGRQTNAAVAAAAASAITRHVTRATTARRRLHPAGAKCAMAPDMRLCVHV